jgi:integrase/recombinase XerD
LLEQARESIPQPLRAATMHTLTGLLASSGLRVGEALRLDRGDIDWSDGVLHIRQSKFNICRFRHMPNYVARRTMLRSAAESRV